MDIIRWRKLVSGPCNQILIPSEGHRTKWLCKSRDIPWEWINQHPLVEARLAWWKDDTTLCTGYSHPNGAFLPIFSYKRADMLGAVLEGLSKHRSALCGRWRKEWAQKLYDTRCHTSWHIPPEICSVIASYVW